MLLSREPETIWRLSGEKATLSASFLWPVNWRVVSPVTRSQRRSVPSHEEERQKLPSLDSVTSETKWLWPRSALTGLPRLSPSWPSCHTSTLLSRLPVMILFGSVSVVAMLVTQLRWPFSSPRRTRESGKVGWVRIG